MRVAIAAAACCILLAGCGRGRSKAIPEPPAAVPAVWKRTALERPPLDTAPQALRAAAPLEWVRASYQSYAVVIVVDIFRMRSSAAAFEALQRWRNEPGSVAFQRGDLFVICSSSMESTQGLIEFSEKLEAEWLGPRRQAGLRGRRSASMKPRFCSCWPAPGAPWPAQGLSRTARRT